MKRIAIVALPLVALAVLFATAPPHAIAKRNPGTPTPSPTPAPLPTATPEPPNIAIPRLQAQIKANPHDQEAMTELAGQYLSINRPDLALALTRHLLEAGDKTAQVYFIDGYAQQSLGQVALAIADLEEASTLDPTNVAVLGNLANLYLAIDRPSDAERVAKRAVAFNKTTPDAYISLGTVYAAESHYDDARLQFEQAFSLDKTSTKPLFSIAQTYAAQNNIPMALQTIDRALAIDPKSVDALSFRADLYARQHDVSRAVEAYDDAAVAAPTDEQKVAVETRKAQFLTSEHRDSDAAAVYQSVLTRYPNVALSYVAYGAFLAATRHEMDQAVAQWHKALSIDPDDEDALRDTGNYEMQRNRPGDAVAYFKHLASVAPTDQNYLLLASAYNALRDYSQQREACKESFAVRRTPETLGCIAGADYALRSYKEAGQIFDALDTYAPGWLDRNGQLLYVAAKTYATLHQRDKAIGAYRRLLALAPRGSKLYKDVQKALVALGSHGA